MTRRRDFLKWTTAAAAAPLFPTADIFAAEVPAEISIRSVAVAMVFEERFSECRRFARSMAATSDIAISMSNDVNDVWDQLHPWFKSNGDPKAIIGLTQGATRFVIELQSANFDLRSVYFGRHKRLPAGNVQHHVFAPESFGAPILLALQSSHQEICQEFLSCVALPSSHSTEAKIDLRTDADSLLVDSNYLESWILT